MVTITGDDSRTLYAGSILTLTCTITLDQTLSSMLSDLSVTSTWTKSGSTLTSSTNRVISPAMPLGNTYSSTVVFNTLHTTDVGNYSCRATVTSTDMSKTAFTTGGEASSQTMMIRVQSKHKSAEITITVQNWLQLHTLTAHIKNDEISTSPSFHYHSISGVQHHSSSLCASLQHLHHHLHCHCTRGSGCWEDHRVEEENWAIHYWFVRDYRQW